jgi:hypothetical protein
MHLRIEVADNGIGMSEEFQKVLFEPFTQERRNDSSEMRGSGLGLSITKRLVDLMGGTISVTSAPWGGTTFRSTLEATACPAGSGRRSAPQAARRGTRMLSRAGASCCARTTRSTRRSPGDAGEPGSCWSCPPPRTARRAWSRFAASAIGLFDAS